jgi:hypothetical protein
VAVAVATLAAFLASSVYYVAATPLERRTLGDRAPDRGRPRPDRVLSELLRTVVVAAAFAWIAGQAHRDTVVGGLPLALVLWLGFPAAILAGSVTWEKVPPVTAAIHAGDWLVKLVLIAAIVGAVR